MNQADFWVIPRWRAISQLLTPFLQLETSQVANIHLSIPSGLSSKMLPSFTVNCFLQPLQNQILRVEMNECSLDSQRGQVMPFGQRSAVAAANALSGSPKYTMASWRVVGKSDGRLLMNQVWQVQACVSSK